MKSVALHAAILLAQLQAPCYATQFFKLQPKVRRLFQRVVGMMSFKVDIIMQTFLLDLAKCFGSPCNGTLIFLVKILI